MGRSERRKRRWVAIIGLAILLVLGGAYAYLRVEWEGADLGDNIASILNKKMRGRISIGSVIWSPTALKKVVTGGWVDVEIHDVKVWDDCALSAELSAVDERRLGDPSEDCTPDHRPDPDPKSKRKPRKLLIDAPKITAQIDVHAAMFGNHDLVFRKIHVYGGQLLLEQTSEPYPLHAYDRTIVSVLTAFYPRMKAGFRAGIYAAEAPPKVDLRDFHVEDLDVLLHFTPYDAGPGKVGYGLAAYIEDVDIDIPETSDSASYFQLNALDPLVPKFYVRLALAGKHTYLRIRDDGPREAFVIPHKKMNDEWAKNRSALYTFELSDITINRLAQMPDQWARKNYVANTLELDITAHTIPCRTPGVPVGPKDGGELQIRGELKNWWDRPYGGEWNLDLIVKNAGPTVRSCIKETFGGEDLHGQIRLRGPFIAKPRIELDLHGLDFDIPLSKTEEPIRLTLAEVDGYIDMVNEQGSIHRTTALIKGGKEPGEVMLSARFGLKPLHSVADIDITKPIDMGRFLPPNVVTSFGRFLAGKMTVGGDTIEGFELKNFDLALKRSQAAKETPLRLHAGRVFAKNSFEWISVEKVRLEAGRNWALFNGGLEKIDGVYNYRNMEIDADFPDLGSLLERFGLPGFARGAGAGKIILNGPVTNPTVTLRTELVGIPCIDTLSIPYAKFEGGKLEAQLSTTGLGGNLKGTLRADVGGGANVLNSLELTGTRVEAAKLCGLKGIIKGTLETVKITVDKRTVIDPNKPATDWLGAATVQVNAPKLNIMGETYSKVSIALNTKLNNLPSWLERRLDPDDAQQCSDARSRGGFCGVIQADRDNGGKLGALVADVPASKAGRVIIHRRLGGTVALDDIPLSLLDPFLGPGVVGGLISGTLHLGGDIKTPSVEIGSTINLTRVYAGGAYIGDAQLGIIPTTYHNVDAIRVYGTMMAGQLGIDGIIGTAKPYPVDLALSGRRVEVDHFVDLTEKLGFTEPFQAWATGTVTVRTELSPHPGQVVEPEAWVELSEVVAIMNHRTREGRQRPLRFEMVPRAKGQFALSARITKDTLDLSCRNYTAQSGREPCPATLTTPAGVITIAGGATASQMKLHAQGELDLARLAPLLENQLEDIDGTLSLEAQVTGTLDKPKYEASLDVKDLISVRLLGGDAVLQVLGPRVVDEEELPGAQIKIANGTVGFSSFTVNVQDDRKDERGELHVTGSIGLAGVKPERWGLVIEGMIAGKMLSAIAPNALSQASGLARIDAALGGTGVLPRIDATIDFDPVEGTRAQPLEIVPRGVRRAITLTGGSVEITTKEMGTHRTYTLDFRQSPLTATIDNEGKVRDIRGLLTVGDGTLERASVSLSADSIPYRATDGTLELLISAKDVRLDLPSATSVWEARGNIAIVNGSYRRNFVLTEAIRPAPEIVAPAKPFWAEYPSIGNADLDLAIEVRKFSVENNIAPTGIEFTGPRLLLSGSPREPRLSGTIRVQRGEFKLPATRAKFTRTSGTIDFAENDKATNPSLEITSDADYFDLSGQAHTITVQIFGTLEQPQWDLRTSTGYDKSQTLALLFLGRSPEQLSRTLGDQSFGGDQTRVDPSTRPGGVGDQLVRELAADWVGGLFGNSLTKFTGLDVLRFEIGFGSVGIHAEKRLLENVRGIGDYEQTTRGSTASARIEVRTPLHLPWQVITDDNLSAQSGYLKKDFTDPAELDIDDAQVKLVYRLFIP